MNFDSINFNLAAAYGRHEQFLGNPDTYNYIKDIPYLLEIIKIQKECIDDLQKIWQQKSKTLLNHEAERSRNDKA